MESKALIKIFEKGNKKPWDAAPDQLERFAREKSAALERSTPLPLPQLTTAGIKNGFTHDWIKADECATIWGNATDKTFQSKQRFPDVIWCGANNSRQQAMEDIHLHRMIAKEPVIITPGPHRRRDFIVGSTYAQLMANMGIMLSDEPVFFSPGKTLNRHGIK